MASRPWERDASALDPVFIVGDARSGTTILYRSLMTHPTFIPSVGIHLVESNAIRHLLGLRRPQDVRWGSLANFTLALRDAMAEVAADIEPLALRRMLVRGTARAIAWKGPRTERAAWLYQRLPAVWKAAGEHHVVRRYFLEAHRRRGAKRLLEKTPSHIYWVPHLAIAFPNARFIFIIRHPLDVLTSYWKRAADDPIESAWMHLTPERFCSRWESATRRAIALDERDSRFLLLRYEEFVTRPAEVIRHALDHVGEPFDEACLLRGPDLEAPPHLRQIPPEKFRQVFHVFGSVKQKTKRWEDFVDRPTARKVEHRLRDAMNLAGYEPRAERSRP